MTRWKKYLSLFLLLFVIGCDSGCIEANQFGEDGEVDEIVINPKPANCVYHIDKKVTDPIQSAAVVACLNQTNAFAISTNSGYKSQFKSVNNKELDTVVCAEFDRMEVVDMSENEVDSKFAFSSEQSTLSSVDKKTKIYEVFSNCRSFCSTECSNGGSAVITKDNDTWKSNTIKTGSSFFGITMDKNSRIQIKVNGAVTLESSLGTLLPFSKSVFAMPVTAESGGENQIISAGTTGTLRFLATTLSLSDNTEVGQQYLGVSSTDVVNAEASADLLRRSYLNFRDVKYDLVNQYPCERLTKYYFQDPKFSQFYCKYNDAKTSCQLLTDYTALLVDNNCTPRDNYTSLTAAADAAYTEDSLNLNIFESADEYYRFATTGFNDLNVGIDANDPGKITYSLNENTADARSKNYKLDTKADQNTNLYTLSYSGAVDGYIWDIGQVDATDLNKTTYFYDSSAFKIAFKLLNLGSSVSRDNCQYRISYTEQRYTSTGDDGEGAVEEVEKTHSYDITLRSDNKNWQTLKNSGRTETEEVILNQYSTVQSGLKRLEFNITVMSGTNCNRGLAIKLLPLKEYSVKKSGVLFLYKDGFTGGSKENLRYAILNPLIMKENINNSTVEAGERIDGYEYSMQYSDFFEISDLTAAITDAEMNYRFNTARLISRDEVRGLDRGLLTLSSDNANYVRKGQILRFDYSNWLQKIDGTSETFSRRTVNITPQNIENAGVEKVDMGIGLFALTKERDAFFCYKKGQEQLDISLFCPDYTTISDSAGGDKKMCPLEYFDADDNNDSCNIRNALKNLFAATITKSPTSEITLNDYLDSLTSSNMDPFQATVQLMTSSDDKIVNGYINNNAYDIANVLSNNGGVTNFIAYVNKTRQCLNSMNANKSAVAYKSTYNAETNIETSQTKMDDYLTNAVKSLSTYAETITPINVGQIFIEFVKLLGIEHYKSQSVDGDSGVNSFRKTINFYTDSYCRNGTKALENGSCPITISQCYDLNNYIGSFARLKKVMDYNYRNASTLDLDIVGNGFLNSKLMELGAKKVQPFNGTKGVLDSNFNISPAEKDETITGEAQGKNIYKYASTFKASSLVMPIYTFIDEGFNPLLVKPQANAVFLSVNAAKAYPNGSRLMMLLGEHGAIYSGNSAEKTDENGLDPIMLIKSDGDKQISKDSRYMFDSSGVLYKNESGKAGAKGLSMADYEGYIDDHDSTTKALFFKVLDADDDLSNNTGYYTVSISNTNVADNFLFNLFRSFMRMILEIFDGWDLDLQVDTKGNFITCTSEEATNKDGNAFCYVYNKSRVVSNGVSCKSGDGNCYASCLNLSTADQKQQFCRYVHDGKGLVKALYQNIINEPIYQFVVKLCLILMLMFYGFGYFLGMSSFTQSELMKRMIRIAIVYTLISATGWNFFYNFVVRFYKMGVDSILFLIASAFEVGNDTPVADAIAVGDYRYKDIIFHSMFDNINLIFSNAVLNKIFGLAFSSWFGFIYLYLVLMAIINYLSGAMISVVYYITSQIFMSLAMAIGPLVFAFLFFEKTKGTFDNWLGILTGFAVQQVFIVITFSFFNNLIYNLIKFTFAYTVCWQSILSLKIMGIHLSIIQFWKVAGMSNTMDMQSAAANAPNFYNIMSFYIVGLLSYRFLTTMADIGKDIGGGIGASGLSGDVTKAINGFKDMVKGSALDKLPMAPVDTVRTLTTDRWEKREQADQGRREDYAKQMNENAKGALKKLQNDAAYQAAGKKDKKAMEKEAIANAKREALLKTHGDQIAQDLAKRKGQDFSSLSKEEQTKAVEEYGVRNGFLRSSETGTRLSEAKVNAHDKDVKKAKKKETPESAPDAPGGASKAEGAQRQAIEEPTTPAPSNASPVETAPTESAAERREESPLRGGGTKSDLRRQTQGDTDDDPSRHTVARGEGYTEDDVRSLDRGAGSTANNGDPTAIDDDSVPYEEAFYDELDAILSGDAAIEGVKKDRES